MTRQTFSGALGDAAGANTKCPAVAQAAGLDGTYLAQLEILRHAHPRR
jgi:hypothetical protein